MAEQVPQEVLDYLEARKTLTLATYGDDGPWAATLTYVNDGSQLYIWTRPQSNTAKHLDQNPVAAFAIDEYTEDWRETKGIQGRGRCAPVDGEGIARAADLFGQKYPQLRPGSTSAVVFYRIEPEALEFINAARADEGDEFGAEFRRQSVFDMPALD
jgi:nitroimidazol reductase NimA-like FMN-containing flavoprotein (pyridoxamine 5'-phosphate oxidase superfamily)